MSDQGENDKQSSHEAEKACEQTVSNVCHGAQFGENLDLHRGVRESIDDSDSGARSQEKLGLPIGVCGDIIDTDSGVKSGEKLGLPIGVSEDIDYSDSGAQSQERPILPIGVIEHIRYSDSGAQSQERTILPIGVIEHIRYSDSGAQSQEKPSLPIGVSKDIGKPDSGVQTCREIGPFGLCEESCTTDTSTTDNRTKVRDNGTFLESKLVCSSAQLGSGIPSGEDQCEVRSIDQVENSSVSFPRGLLDCTEDTRSSLKNEVTKTITDPTPINTNPSVITSGSQTKSDTKRGLSTETYSTSRSQTVISEEDIIRFRKGDTASDTSSPKDYEFKDDGSCGFPEKTKRKSGGDGHQSAIAGEGNTNRNSKVTSTFLKSTECTEESVRKANKSFESGVSSPTARSANAESSSCRQGNGGICLPLCPDVLELNLAGSAGKVCQENHQPHQPGKTQGYRSIAVQPNLANTSEDKLTSSEEKLTGIGSIYQDLPFNLSTHLDFIGNYSGIQENIVWEENTTESDGCTLDSNLKERCNDVNTKFVGDVRDCSGDSSGKCPTETGFSYDLDRCTYVKAEFSLIARGQKLKYPVVEEANCTTNDRRFRGSRPTPATDSKGVLIASTSKLSVLNNGANRQYNRFSDTTSCLMTYDTSRVDTKAQYYNQYQATQTPVRRRKVSSAGLCKQYFCHRNIDGVPRSRSLSPLTLRQSVDLSDTKHRRDKIRLNAVSDDSNLGYSKDFVLSNAEHKWSTKSTVYSIDARMETSGTDCMTSERKPQLGRSYSFRSNTLGRIRKKRSHSLESSKRVSESLNLITGNEAVSMDSGQEKSNMATGVLAKPKLPSFDHNQMENQEENTDSKVDPDMEELKTMLDVLKVDFVRKYSRDPRSYTPGTASPKSVPQSPRSSPSSCQSSLSDLQARLNSIKHLTSKLRLKHGGSPGDSPTTEMPLRNIGEEASIVKAKSVGDILEEEYSSPIDEKPIRRTKSAKDHEMVNESEENIDLDQTVDAECGSLYAGHGDGHAPRDRPGSPFKTAISESLEHLEPGVLPYGLSPNRLLLSHGEIHHGETSLNEFASLPRFRRVKDTSVFTKQTTVVHRKVSSGPLGGLKREISVESTGVQSEHEDILQVESIENEESTADGADTVDTVDINVQVLEGDSRLDEDTLDNVSLDLSFCTSDTSSIVEAGERRSGDFSAASNEVIGDTCTQEPIVDFRQENRLSSEDEGLGIAEFDTSTENVSGEGGAGKGGVSWSNWTKIFRPKPKVHIDVSIAEQFNMIARQQSKPDLDDEDEEADHDTTPECQRTGRKSRRTVTHPTFSAVKHPLIGEVGSLDSNGLGSLHDRRLLGVSSSVDLTQNCSDTSLADTGFVPSEDLETTYEEVVEETTEPLQIEKVDKKCTKSPKTKSKSDPTQKKGVEFEFPQVISAAHALSSPSISFEGRPKSPELIITEDKCAKKSLSDNFLALQDAAEASGDSATESVDTYKVPIIDHRNIAVIKDKPPVGPTPIPAPRRVSKKQRAKSNVEIPHGEKERHHTGTVGACSDDDSAQSGSRNISRSNTAPNTPNSQSPTGSLDRTAIRQSPTGSLDRRTTNTLSISSPGRAVAGRSKSTASVFANAVKKKYIKSGNGSTTALETTESPRKQSFDSKMTPGASDPDLLTPSSRLSTCSTASAESEPWNRTSPCATPPKERSPPLAFRHDKRFHVVQELYNVEKEYVEALRVLVEKYMIPLKSSTIIDSAIVDDIFYKVPEILNHHAVFLDFLERAFLNWDENQTVGQHIYNTFSKSSVVESYESFIQNYKTSERILEHLFSNKTSFQKFVEQCQRENRRKLPLKALIIQPAQRIPRYELLIRRLIGHTPKEHADHQLLLEAESSIHELALKINTVKETKQEEIMQESLKQLEILLMTDLSVPDRMYIKHDMVAVMSRKEQCCVWLFSDLLIISAIKRKTGTVKKASLRLQSPSGQDFVDNVKHKVWLRIGLDDVDIIKTGSLTRKSTVDKEVLEDDFSLLGQALDVTNKLSCSHQVLEETIRDMMTTLQRQITEHHGRVQELTKLDLMTTTQEGVNIIGVIFPSIEKRIQWESVFSESKQRLASATDRKPPDFLQSLPITKTRAGMQFSCAAPIDGLNSNNYRDVWVCNSDGHVGHMCLLTLEPEPIVTLNTPVPGCNSRILCVCAVPAQAQPFKRLGSCKGCRRKSCLIHQPAHSPVKIVHDSCSSSDDSSSSSDDDEFGDAEAEVKSSDDDEKGCKSGALYDPYKSTMWLGTEDGFIMIFQCTDNIKTTRNKLRIQHTASILSMVYLDSKVFVSLANGDLIIYRRLPEGTWNTDHPETKSIGTSVAPINRMLVVAGKLWCGCHKEMIVLNPATVGVERCFLLPGDADRPVHCMASSTKGVWIALQNSSKVSLYNATTFEFLIEVNVAQIVAQKLAAADDIIRQHKTACLRITSLMACKDLLWVGTSAGIILTVALPIISTTTNRNNITMPNVTGLIHGHTGHVRFLTCVEMPMQMHPGDTAILSRRASMTPGATTMATKMLVISGGDGYEDFQGNPHEDTTGKDDSTNHLLLWQV